MIITLAVSASATFTTEFKAPGWGTKVQVSGGQNPAADAICYTLMAKVKVTVTSPNHHCGPSEDDDDGKPCNGECMTFGFNSDPSGFDEGQKGYGEKFCFAKKQVIDVDFSDISWDDDTSTGVSWLELNVGSWVEGNDGSVKFEIFDANGKLLAPGTSCDNEECAGTANCGKAATNDGADDNTANDNTVSDGVKDDLKTGVTGVAVLGGVAILAAGAVAVSRKRK